MSRSEQEVPDLRESLARYVRVSRLLVSYLGSFGKMAALGWAVATVGLVTPQFTRILIDRVYPSGDVSLLTALVTAMLASILFQQVMGTLRGYYGQVVSAHLTADTSVFMVNHVQHLPLRFFQRIPVGDILSRFGDLSGSLASIRRLFDFVFVRGFFLVLIPPLLLMMNWRLALVAFAALPLTWMVNALSARKLRMRWKGVAEARAQLRALNVETLSHVELLKCMGLEREVFRRTKETAGSSRAEALDAARFSAALGLMNGMVRSTGSMILTYIGWRMIISGELTLGTFMAFMAYLGRVQGPLAQVTSRFSEFQRTAIALDRLFELLDEPVEADPTRLYDPSYTAARLQFRGAIRVQDLGFAYKGGDFRLGVPHLCLQAGSFTGIVGESGSGKSTLLRLLAGVERPTEGTIFYGEQPHQGLPASSIRRSVAVAWHSSDLLRGSLRSNIIYGIEEVDEDRLEEVVSVCQLDALVSTLPQGLDTPVAEWGSTLSAGQQQRLAIARALVRDVPLVLLDEVTSNLDPETEARLMTGLRTFLQGRTVVLASHRATTIRYSDLSHRMENGRIVTSDTGIHVVAAG